MQLFLLFFKKIVFQNHHFTYLCIRIKKHTHRDGSVAQLDRALDYGSRGLRFESLRSHFLNYLGYTKEVQGSLFWNFSELTP